MHGAERLRALQGTPAEERWGSLEANRDSLPNDGNVTGREPANLGQLSPSPPLTRKSQRMRWDRYTVRPVLDGTSPLNGTLEETFRAMHLSFRPLQCPPIPTSSVPHALCSRKTACGRTVKRFFQGRMSLGRCQAYSVVPFVC